MGPGGSPPKVHFFVSKMAFSRFPVPGLCRGPRAKIQEPLNAPFLSGFSRGKTAQGFRVTMHIGSIVVSGVLYRISCAQATSFIDLPRKQKIGMKNNWAQ